MAPNQRANLNGNGRVDRDEIDDERSEEEVVDPDDEIQKLEHITTRTKLISLGISRNYAPDMEPWQAFREIVQNWKDAIIERSKVSEAEFRDHIIREESTIDGQVNIVYKIRNCRTEPREWLGYVRFQGKPDQETNQITGTVEIVNRFACLELQHLQLGGTTKRENPQLAGTHGEGFKLAALVMLRTPNHDITCVSGGWNWRFDFGPDKILKVHLTRMSDDKRNKEVEKSNRMKNKGTIPFTVDPHTDVTFVIGGDRIRKDRQGNIIKRRVPMDDFKTWTKAALFLEEVEEGGLITTSHGDLVVTNRLCQNIYMKGLLLKESTEDESASVGGHRLKYGYNFARGKTDRDRHSMASAQQESKAIHAIWAQVVTKRQPALVSELSDILNCTPPLYAEAVNAYHYIGPRTAESLRDHLFSDKSKWYYSAEENSQNPRLSKVIEGLGRERVELTDTYWRTLKQHRLIRTAEEEQNRRFILAPAASIPQDEFAIEIHRLLRAGLKVCPQTTNTEVQFVDAGELSLLSIYLENEDLIKVHSGWLVQANSVKELGLDADLVQSDVVYHTVKHLLVDALDQVPAARFGTDGDYLAIKSKNHQKIQSEQQLLNYTRIRKNFRIHSPSGIASVHVEWSKDAGWKPNLQVKIQLHRLAERGRFDGMILACNKAPTSISVNRDPEIKLENDEQKSDLGLLKLESFDLGFVSFDHLAEFAGLEVFATASVTSDEAAFVVLTNGNCNISQPQRGPSPALRVNGQVPVTFGEQMDFRDASPGPESGSCSGEVDDGDLALEASPASDIRGIQSRRRSDFLVGNKRPSNRPNRPKPRVPPGNTTPQEDQSDTHMMNNDEVPSDNVLSEGPFDPVYELGERLEFVNIATTRHWYKLMGPEGEAGIAGIPSTKSETEEEAGGKSQAGPSRKRRCA